MSNRGDRNPSAKLREWMVADIKYALSIGARVRDLAEDFAVSESTIYSIKSGRRWGHVDPG